jgi:hypothetical protein
MSKVSSLVRCATLAEPPAAVSDCLLALWSSCGPTTTPTRKVRRGHDGCDDLNVCARASTRSPSFLKKLTEHIDTAVGVIRTSTFRLEVFRARAVWCSFLFVDSLDGHTQCLSVRPSVRLGVPQFYSRRTCGRDPDCHDLPGRKKAVSHRDF